MKKAMAAVVLSVLSFVFIGISYAQDITINVDTVWQPGTYTYDNVLVASGATLTFNGAVTLNAKNLTIDPTSAISSDGKGYLSAQGPGAGLWSQGKGGGAGYGGKGSGTGFANIYIGGPVYGSSLTPVDSGSGGGLGGYGGSGGGAIRINISDTLIVNGSITAGGANGRERISTLGGEYNLYGGGGSGGSVYLTSQNISGSGNISANGGNGAAPGGGGGGGRIAVYYQLSSFTGTAQAQGGTGGTGSGEEGTIVFRPPSSDLSVAFFNLIEKSYTDSISQETLSAQSAAANNIEVTGALNGTLNFNDFGIVNISSGPFSGKGFSKAGFTSVIEGVSYSGALKGVTYLISSENRVYIKGEIEGKINGTYEGYLLESIPGSRIYDKLQAACKISKLKDEITSANVNMQGTLIYQPPHNFTSELYLYQANYEGVCFGSYTGPISAVLTHLRLASENEYRGEGLSIISYNTTLGQGQGYAYNNKHNSTGITGFRGLFESPLLGKLDADMDGNKAPKVISGTIERLDLGLAPVSDLKITSWGPWRVSPGQAFDYIIELRNDGLRAVQNVELIDKLPFAISFYDSTVGGNYNEDAHQVVFQMPEVAAKAIMYKRVTGVALWGIPPRSTFGNIVYIPKEEVTLPPIDPAANIDYEVIEDTPESASVNIKVSNQTENVETAINIKVNEGAGQIQPSFDVTATPLAVTTTANFSLGSFPPSIVEGEWDAQNRSRERAERAIDTARRIIGTAREGVEITKSIKREDEFLAWLYEKGYIDQTNYELYTQLKTPGYHGLRFFLPRIADRLMRDLFSPLGQCLRRLLGINDSQARIREGILKTIDGMKFYSDKQLESVIRASIPEVLRRGGVPVETIERAWELFLKEKGVAVNSQISSVLTVHDPNELSVSPEGKVKPGDKLSYTINYENEGEGTAYGVYITDTLEEDLDDSTLILNDSARYDHKTRVITWFVGELQSKQKGSVAFSVNVNKDAADKSEVINFATVYFPSVPEATRTNGAANMVTTSIDNVAPVTGISASPSPNQSGWNNSDVTINLTAKDNGEGAAGVKEVHYNLTGAVSDARVITGASAQIAISAEGATNITYYALDNAGNAEAPQSLEVKIDKTPPGITAEGSPQANSRGWNNTDVVVAFTGNDNLSGVASVTGPSAVTTEGKDQIIGGEAIDLAGNRAAASVTLNIDKTAPEAKIYFNKDNKTLKVEGVDNLSLPAVIQQGNVFTVSDKADNILKLNFKELKQHGKEIKAELASLQYGARPVIQLPETGLKYEWSLDKKSDTAKELEQEIEVEGQVEVKAKYNHEKNETKIKTERQGEKESEQRFPGLIIIKLATNSGLLDVSRQ